MRKEAQRLKEEALLNTEEDARFGEPLRGDELPEELRRREDRLAAAAKERAGSGQGARGRGVSGASSVCKRFRQCEGPLFAGET